MNANEAARCFLKSADEQTILLTPRQIQAQNAAILDSPACRMYDLPRLLRGRAAGFTTVVCTA